MRNIDLIEARAIEQARKSFWAYRQYINPKLKKGWWQREISRALQQFYVDFLGGKKPKLVIQAPPQHGKLLADETPVFTPNGWRKHGDLAVGDYVFGSDGLPTRIVAVSEKSNADMRVELTNGEVVYCHERHEWTLHNRHKKRYETLETTSIKNLTSGEIGKRGSRYMYHLPKRSCLITAEKQLPLDPYVLGAWLGDGTQVKPDVSYASQDEAIIKEIERRGFPVRKKYVHKITGVIRASFGGGLSEKLKEAGVFTKKYGERKKHIPDVYLTASKEQRLELLAGLMDTDGYCYHKNGRCVYTTSDERLAKTFEYLISTFGWTFSTVVEKPKLSSSGVQGKVPYFVIGFNPDCEIPTVLGRKKNKIIRINKRKTAIKSINYDPQGKIGHCIQVENADGLYCFGKTMQLTHNSSQIIDFISWISGHNPDLKTIYTSFSERLGVRANLQLQRMLTSPRYKKVFNTRITEETVDNPEKKLRNRDILEFLGSTGYFRNTTVNGSITGESLDIGIIDDPIKGREEANSQNVRDKTWDWLLDDFFSRFSEDAGMLAILTRWHVDDPIGRLLERISDIKLISYPAIATEDEEHRKKGEALFPEHKSLDFLLERKNAMHEASWEALYQQNPVILDGNFFKPEKIEVIDALPKVVKWVRGWDFGATDGGGDYTSGLRLGQLADGRYVIADLTRGRWSPEERDNVLANIASQDGTSTLVAIPQDPGQAGKSQVMYLTRKLAGFNVKSSAETGSKVTRAEPFAAQVNVGNVLALRGKWNTDLFEEMRMFPNGKHDDAVDSASRAFSELLTTRRPLNIAL